MKAATRVNNPIEEVWRVRDELGAEEGCEVHTVFEILRREEKKHGDRRRSGEGHANSRNPSRRER